MFNWKTSSSDLVLQEYKKPDWIMPDEFSLEGWNRANYTIWSGKARDFRTVYHCIFTCPFTGTHYPCGQLEKSQLVAIDGAFWYKTEKRALQAAAEKAIDCLNLGENQASRRCMDEPNVLPSGPILPSMPYFLAKDLSKKRLAVVSKNRYTAKAAQ